MYGEDTVAFLKEKTHLKESIDDMATTCKLTDIVLKNNSVEMLLLKREMEERLEVLLGSKLQQLPTSIQQRVKVVPARVKLGSLAACVADEDEIEARPMVIVINDDEASDEDEEEEEEETSEDESVTSGDDEEEEKGAGEKEKDEKPEVNSVEESAREKLLKESANCDRDYFFARIVDAYVQTDDVVVAQVNIDALKPRDSVTDEMTQTECPLIEDRATSPARVDECDIFLVTDGTDVGGHHTQTDSFVTAEQHQQVTPTKLSTADQSTNTRQHSTTEQATETNRVELSEEHTDTSGLVELCGRATFTDNAACVSVGVATDSVPTSDKSTTASFAVAQERQETVTSSVNSSIVAKMISTYTDVDTHPVTYGDASVLDHDNELLHNDTGMLGQVVSGVAKVSGVASSHPTEAVGTVNDPTDRITCDVITQTSLSLVGVSLLPNTIQRHTGTNTSTALYHDATYMTIDQSVSATPKTIQDKISTADIACGTEAEQPEVTKRAAMVTQETSMQRCVTAHDQATCTETTTTVDEATSMQRCVTAHDQATSTTEKTTASEATSMNRCVTAHDQATCTMEKTTADEATSMQRFMIAHDQATCTATTTTANVATSTDHNTSVDVATLARAETADFGMLKRPRSVSRGSGGHPTRTAEKSVTTTTFDVTEAQTNTPLRQFTNASSATPEVSVRSRQCSPLRVPVADRASSPFVSTVATQDGATSCRPERSYVDRAASPIRFVREVGTCMGSVQYVDSACSPVHTPTRDNESMTEGQKTASVATATRQVALADSATQMKRTKMATTGTGMSHVNYTDKETSTRHVLFVNKNVSTENILTADKQTATAVDITAAYRSSIAASTCRVTRGTCTPAVVMATRHTSPPPATPIVHRASSPVLVPRRDKAVSVTRGELREPVDTFQSVGRPSVPLKPAADVTTTTIPRLASIDEDSHETSDDDGHQTAPPPPSTPTHSPRFSPSGETRFSFHESLFSAASFARPDARRSTVLGGGGGGGGASSILCTVESATNTSGVETHTTGTCTPPPAETEDKAVCTEAVTVGGKMAECITKLKTVRHRLEQQQPPTAAITAAIMADGRALSGKSGVVRQEAIDSSSIDTSGRGSELSGKQLHRSLARKKRLGLADLLVTSLLPDSSSPPAIPPANPRDAATKGGKATNGVGVSEAPVTTAVSSAELNCESRTQKTPMFADGSTNTDISLSMSSTDVDFRYLLTSGRRPQDVSEDQTVATNGRRQLLKTGTERKSTFEQLRSLMSDRRKSSTEKVPPGGSSIATLGKGLTPLPTVSPSAYMSDTARKRLEQRLRGSIRAPVATELVTGAALSPGAKSTGESGPESQSLQSLLEPEQTKQTDILKAVCK